MGDKGKAIHHIIIEYSKLTQKVYETGCDWARKMIQKDLCKKLKLDHTTE